MKQALVALCTAILPALTAASAAAQMKTYEIVDRHGFDQPLVAYSLDIPRDWQAEGQILWQKPCSGNELYELVLTARSPDGLTGLRVMPGHQILWMDTAMGGLDPYMTQLMRAEIEAQRNKLRTQFRGSNCHVAQITDPDQIFDTLVLQKRPPGTQVIARRPNEALKATLNQVLGPSQPGFQVFHDAFDVQMTYALNGVPVIERMGFSWYMFQTELNDPTMRSLSQHTVVNALQFDWAPTARQAADHAVLKQIAASFRANPDWQKRVLEVQRKIAEQRRQHHADAAERRKWDRLYRDIVDDIQHYRFLDYIRQ